MNDWSIKLLLVAGLAWFFWSVFRPRYIFVITIEAGRPTLLSGKVTSPFLGSVQSSCRDTALGNGRITGVQRGRRIALRFSSNIESGVQQQFRNAWVAEG